jgi:phosphate transport system permease protein
VRAAPVHPFDRRNRAWYIDAVARTVVMAGGVSTILFVVAILVFIAGQGIDFAVHRLDWSEFFGSDAWRPTSAQKPTYGALALFAGTAAVTGLAILISAPLSFGAAIYVAEFAPVRRREWFKVLIELLAAIPSVVWGFVGVYLLGPILMDTLGAPSQYSVLNAGIILGLMAAPIMTTIAEDALKAVPDSRWQVVRRVVLPHARPGLSSALLLGIGRAFGETMAVLMATGHSINIPHSLLDSARTLTATIAAELGEAGEGTDHYQALFVLGTLLFTITFLVNMTADVIVRGRRSR